jgi:hypothetical protein
MSPAQPIKGRNCKSVRTNAIPVIQLQRSGHPATVLEDEDGKHDC